MYLVDTDILSAGAPGRGVPALAVVGWMERNSAALYLSVITIAEIEGGIAKSRRKGADRKVTRLTDWLDALLHLYGSRVLPVDLDVARCIGGLADRVRSQGQEPGLADLAIAATAHIRGWTVLTRNVKRFAPTGVPALDPFTLLPADAA